MGTWTSRSAIAAIAIAIAIAGIAMATPGCAGQRNAPTETQPADTRTPAAGPEPDRVHAPALAPAPPASPETPSRPSPAARTPIPRATLTRLEIKGAHDTRFMRILFENQSAKLATCFMHARNVDPYLGGGSVTWQLRMDRWGRIGAFDVVARSLLSPTFESCARTILATLHGTEASAGSNVTVAFSLEPDVP